MKKRETEKLLEESTIVKDIVLLLKQNSSLKELALSQGVNIGYKEAIDISDVLKQNSSLITLDFSKNNTSIGDKGIIAICHSLKHNSSLKVLNLAHNKIGDEGAKAIGDLLKHNSSLNVLDLQFNEIGDEGTKAIGDSLKHNNSLIDLQISNINTFVRKCTLGNQLGNQERDKFINFLQRNKKYVEDTAEFLLSKFVNKDKEFGLGEEIKYFKHYQVCDKDLIEEYFQKNTKNGNMLKIPTDVIDYYIAEHFLELMLVAKKTEVNIFSIEELSGEICSYLDKSLWQAPNELELSGDNSDSFVEYCIL